MCIIVVTGLLAPDVPCSHTAIREDELTVSLVIRGHPRACQQLQPAAGERSCLSGRRFFVQKFVDKRPEKGTNRFTFAPACTIYEICNRLLFSRGLRVAKRKCVFIADKLTMN